MSQPLPLVGPEIVVGVWKGKVGKGLGLPRGEFCLGSRWMHREKDLGKKMFDLKGVAIMSPEGAFLCMLSRS